ncbi:TonB-dependent siderophore receptor [Gilvimarinus algae]|uniref:TonB-dependent siderophore receptor n=1 Tax=Gilvimarinus algae TaxID=3058037 RepID=A0ABT8TI84_9GAMM|nr:TonB-dependent siderophore receptor [Gilvimarinus sp. SDUM040014]MDO3383745.1 TonB-dependent siderophore receptor [Gilvimarinus sp. SDUM040014]
MTLFSRRALALAVALYSGAAYAQNDKPANQNDTSSAEPEQIETLLVYGEPDTTKTATKLNLSVFETPQMVSVISRAQIDDFALREVNALLNYVPGVTVEQVETDRTYYTARGFDIVNFQYDGVGVPFSYGLTQGHDDTAIYEQVEVVKGATGLTTGLANPSATINYVRKRPTDEFQASVSAAGGSWDYYRLDGDVSGTIVDDKLKGRLVVARQEGDSYLDRYAKELSIFYGVLSGSITDSTRWSLGHSINDNHNDGMSSGALPLFYSDGSLTDYDVSTNTAPDWAYQDVTQHRSFAELEQDLGERWMLKAIFTRNKQEKEWENFYLSGAPDPLTEEGLVGVASRYEAQDKEDIVDLFVSGSFSLFGRDHELVAGINLADIKLTGRSIYSSAWGGYDDPVGGNWAEGATPYPAMDIDNPESSSTDIDQTQNSYYVSTRLNLTDKLSLLLGARNVDIEQEGISYSAPQNAEDDETVPYAGITYEVINGTMLYASYSEVFKAQTWVDADLAPLGPVQGEGTEVGVKQELFNGAAVLTAAWFESRQENFGEWVTRDIETGLNIYRGAEFESDGFELELAGELLTGLNISAGYTQVDVTDENGNDTRRFIPGKQFKLATAYQVPALNGLRLGGGINWQSEIYYAGTEVQDSYALVDLFAQYDLSANLTLGVNLNNLTDEKYRLSPQWGQANFGAPRSVVGSVTWTY